MKRKKNLRESITAFRKLAENSPLEAPVAGNNRHLRYMSPTTRELVLKARMPEIMAFAEDRMVDPSIVAGIAEATMRLGRIPDLGMYGLAGDEALAVKDFLADTILNVAEDELNKIAPIAEGENGSSKAKHLKLAADYHKLAEFHKRRAKEELDKSKIAKDDGRAHSSIKANAASEQHKTLAAHCMGLADYHQIKANEITGNNVSPPQYPAQNPKKTPEEPPQDAEKKAPLEKTDPEPDAKGSTKAQDGEKPVSAELDTDDDDKPEKKDDKDEKSEAADPFSMAGRQLGKKAGGAIAGAIKPELKPAGQALGGQLGSAAGKLAGEYLKKKKSSYSEQFSSTLANYRSLREGDKPGFLNRTAGGIAGKIGGGLVGGAVGGPAGARIGSVAGGVLGAHQGITGLAKAAMPGGGANMVTDMAKKAFNAAKPGLAPAPAPAAPAPVAPKPMTPAAPGQPPAPPNPPEDKQEQTVGADVKGPLLGIGTGAFPSRTGSIMPAIMRKPVKPPYTEWAGREDLKRDLDRKGFSKIEASRSGTGMPKGNPKADEEPGSKKERAADEVTPMEGQSRFRTAELLDDLLTEKKKEKKNAKEDKDTDPDKVAKKGNANNKIAPLFHNLGHKLDHAKTKAEGKKYSDEWAKRLENLCKNEGGSAASDAVLKYSLTNPWVREQGFTDEASNLRRKWETAMSDDARAHAMDVAPTAPEPVVLTINKFIKMSDK